MLVDFNVYAYTLGAL